MLQISNPQKGGGLVKGIHYPSVLRYTDNKKVGFSKQSDGTTDADGTLYPTNFNDNQYLGSIPNFINANYASSGTLPSLFTDTTNIYADNGSKVKVAEAFTQRIVKWLRLFWSALKVTDSNTNSPDATNDGMPLKTVKLDATRALLIYKNANGYTELVVATQATDGTISLGTPNTTITYGYGISQTGNGYHIDAVLINTDKVALVMRNSSGYMESRVITISGTTVTANTAYQITTNNWNWFSVTKIATDKFLVVHTNGSTTEMYACSVSGTTITVGAVNSIASRDYKLLAGDYSTADKGMIVARDTGTQETKARAFTVSGTTITLGTELTLSGMSWSTGYPSYGAGFSNILHSVATDEYILVNTQSGSQTENNVAYLTVSGTTITRTHSGNFYHSNGSSFKFLKTVQVSATRVAFYGYCEAQYYTAMTVLVDFDTTANSITAVSAKWLFGGINGYNTYPSTGFQQGYINFIDFANVVLIGWQSSTAYFKYRTGAGGTIVVYADDTTTTPIATLTDQVQLGANMDSIVANVGTTKGYLKIKNTMGHTATITVDEVNAEVA